MWIGEEGEEGEEEESSRHSYRGLFREGRKLFLASFNPRYPSLVCADSFVHLGIYRYKQIDRKFTIKKITYSTWWGSSLDCHLVLGFPPFPRACENGRCNWQERRGRELIQESSKIWKRKQRGKQKERNNKGASEFESSRSFTLFSKDSPFSTTHISPATSSGGAPHSCIWQRQDIEKEELRSVNRQRRSQILSSMNFSEKGKSNETWEQSRFLSTHLIHLLPNFIFQLSFLLFCTIVEFGILEQSHNLLYDLGLLLESGLVFIRQWPWWIV